MYQLIQSNIDGANYIKAQTNRIISKYRLKGKYCHNIIRMSEYEKWYIL